MSTVSTIAAPPASTPGSGIESRHPLFTEFQNDWVTMRDTYRGERVVKERGVRYLPPTSGMEADGLSRPGTEGFRAYAAYRKRAFFPDVVNDAVEAMLGVMHHKPANIELPAAMEPMRDRATIRHETLDMLLRRINEEQLVTGRLGLLLDLSAELSRDPAVTPYIAMYRAEKIINWDEGVREENVFDSLNLVVLDESEFERKRDFEWEVEKKFRVLVLGDPELNEPSPGGGDYRVGVFRDEARSFAEASLMTPVLRGRKLDEIPFTFINSKDIVPTPEDPPLIGLASLALAIYRGEADYRQALFLQGQDTFVITGVPTEGEGEAVRVGANAVLRLPTGADAKFVGVESAGLTEMREALESDRARAMQKGGQLLDSVSRERESGDALRVRVAARTATLNQIALAGAFGLQNCLRQAARWMGLDPMQVRVEPNLDFMDDTLAGQELVQLATARSLGAPLSLRSLHQLMFDRGLTTTPFEEELVEIEGEAPLDVGGSTSPMGPEPPDDPLDEDEDEDA